MGLQNLQERTHAVSQIRTIMFVCNASDRIDVRVVTHLLIHHASNPQPLTASRSALSTAPSLQQPLGQLHSRTQHSARTAVSDGIIDNEFAISL